MNSLDGWFAFALLLLVFVCYFSLSGLMIPHAGLITLGYAVVMAVLTFAKHKK